MCITRDYCALFYAIGFTCGMILLVFSSTSASKGSGIKCFRYHGHAKLPSRLYMYHYFRLCASLRSFCVSRQGCYKICFETAFFFLALKDNCNTKRYCAVCMWLCSYVCVAVAAPCRCAVLSDNVGSNDW